MASAYFYVSEHIQSATELTKIESFVSWSCRLWPTFRRIAVGRIM